MVAEQINGLPFCLTLFPLLDLLVGPADSDPVSESCTKFHNFYQISADKSATKVIIFEMNFVLISEQSEEKLHSQTDIFHTYVLNFLHIIFSNLI